MGVCDYPYNVDCKGAATPSPPPSTASPTIESTASQTQSTTQTQPQPQPQPQPPSYGPQPPSYGPQPPPPAYASVWSNPWLAKAGPEGDLWHQRPVAPLDTQKQEEEEEEEELIEEQPQQQQFSLENPWQLLQNIPASLATVPCESGKIHSLNESCSNVVVCRNGRPQLVQCSTGLKYDRLSDSCKPISVAKW